MPPSLIDSSTFESTSVLLAMLFSGFGVLLPRLTVLGSGCSLLFSYRVTLTSISIHRMHFRSI